MIIAYIVHPISGDIQGNLAMIRHIVRKINLERTDVVPFVPYYVDIVAMDDTVPEERARGIMNDHHLFHRRVMDELWVYGDRLSSGMRAEIELAKSLGIPVVFKNIKIRNVNEKSESI